MRKNEPRTLADALAAAMKDLGITPRMQEYDVVNLWPSIVGERIAAVAAAESIQHGKLVVRVSKATWRNELMFLKKDLIMRINDVVGKEIVKDILFR